MRNRITKSLGARRTGSPKRDGNVVYYPWHPQRHPRPTPELSAADWAEFFGRSPSDEVERHARNDPLSGSDLD